MTREHYAGVPAQEVIAFAELMNGLELQNVEMFGDSVNSAIVTNIKAADLKGQRVSIRGLARVIGLQPSTIRRRIAGLIEQGWLIQDETGVHFPEIARERGAPLARAAMLRFAFALNKLGWGDFRPPP
ncbi:MAG TPA: helix-turn-helix domain-containing protein [Rhizomicrobium sp.]|nr:helix-turn-helix domain-containing protein [Rhizomicrobium sp.]